MKIDFFKYIDDLREFAPQIKSSAKLDSFSPFQRPSKQRIENIITAETYTQLLDYFNDAAFDKTTIEGKAVVFLQGALANFMAIPYFIFESSERNGTDNSLYRYQEDQQKEIYLDNAWAELDHLLSHMDANSAEFAGYAASDRFKLREKLYLKSPSDFTRYFGIDNSAYFFNNSILLQEEVVNEEVKSRIKAYPVVTGDDLKWALGKAVAYRVIAKACTQFDYTELPKSLRADIVKEREPRAGRGDTSELNLKERFAKTFTKESDLFFMKVDSLLNETRNAGVYTVPTDTLTEDDKFFMPI